MNLSQICDSGDVRALEAHLVKRPDDLQWAIQSAAQGEHLEILEVVLRHKPSQWALDVGLEQAARRPGAVAFVRALLAAGAAAAGNDLSFPLWAAAAAGDVDSLQVLLAAGADPNARRPAHQDPDGKICLLAAIRSRRAPAVAALLAAGADPNVMTPALRRPLDVAEELGDAAIVQLLRERGARVVAPEELDLGQATRRGFLARVQALLPGASPEDRGGALVTAVQDRQPAIATAILDHGDIDARKLAVALAQCIAFDVQDIVPRLLAAGVDPNSADNYYHAPPIVLAADRGRVAAVRALIAAGVDLQARDEEGRNPLAAARSRGHAEVVDLLQAAGATARTPAAIEAATRKKLATHARDAWLPELGDADERNPSRFGGRPWLLANEPWPTCSECQAGLVFFAQIDLAATPPAAQETFGAGLLQMFHCTACDPYAPFSGAGLVRIIDRSAATPARPPEGVTEFPARTIAGWGSPVKDYPYREADTTQLEPEERAILFKLNRQGDKLGGWPNWVQDVEHPRCPCGEHRMTQQVLQIDSNRGVPYTWGDNGVGFILQCPQHREQVAFLWQCS